MSRRTSSWHCSRSTCFLPSILSTHSQSIDRYPNLYEVRLIPTKKDIAFVEYLDEGSATVAKDALHNYKLDGENKIKVSGHHCSLFQQHPNPSFPFVDYIREEVMDFCDLTCALSPYGFVLYQYILFLYLSHPRVL